MKEIDIDKHVLTVLLREGSDMTKLHPIFFFLYFPIEENAKLAANVLKRDGFDVEVTLPSTSNRWLCLAGKEMLPLHGELVELRQWFNSIASELDGEYDGWETQIIQ